MKRINALTQKKAILRKTHIYSHQLLLKLSVAIHTVSIVYNAVFEMAITGSY